MTQEEALSLLKTGVNIFLTGEPGSGKSHTVRTYVQYLRSHGIEPAITASTGIAATHIGGMTIHSWSGIGINKYLSAKELQEIASRDRLVKRMLATHVLIIDEISMLNGATLNLVDVVCRTIKRKDLPFGGMQIIFVGDFFQLPPVTREGKAPAQFAFDAQAWKAANPTICYLSEQHRQEDPDFLEILAAIRTNRIEEHHKLRLQERHHRDTSLSDITKLFPHNADVDRINNEHLARLPGTARAYTMNAHGNPNLIEQLKRGCLSPDILQLKKNARVMFTKNHPENGFVNGTTGEVTDFAKETGYPIVTLRSGRTIEAVPDNWAIEVDGKALAAITQLPLRLAWAMTVHKSQGMSLDAAFVDLSGAFAFGQGYVALSRVRTLAGLLLGGLNARALEVDTRVLEQDNIFRSASNEAQHVLHTTDGIEYKKLHETFITTCGGTLVAKILIPGTSVREKPKKEKRWEQTLALILAGKTVTDVAKERGRTEGTILEHLEDLKTLGTLPLEKITHILVLDPDDVNEIHHAFQKCAGDQLRPVHDFLEGRFSFENLRLARLFLKH